MWLASLSGDADALLYSQWHSDSWGRRNYSFYKNPKVDELLVRARSAVDPRARAELQAPAQALIVEECADVFKDDTSAGRLDVFLMESLVRLRALAVTGG